MKLPAELQFIQAGREKPRTTDARMDGKVAVVSGATSGVGYQAARKLAQAGAHLVLVCRNPDKADRVKAELARDFQCQVQIVLADFEKLVEVARAGDEISRAFPQVHVLVNNAGIHNTRRRLTDDGNEAVFQVIHLASFLLIKKLEKNLKNGAPARIININSEAHRFGGLNLDDLDWAKRPYIALRAYGAAKIAQLLCAMEFSERLAGSQITVNVMHPGEVRTNIGMNNGFFYRFYNHFILRWFLKDPAIAGSAIYYLAAAPELEKVTGKFFNKTIEEPPASYVMSAETQKRIWERSEELVRPYLEKINDL